MISGEYETRPPLRKSYTCHQNQVSGFIQRRLDYFFVSKLQDFVKKTDVFASFSTDHSPIFFSFEKGSVRGRGLWKFNKSLMSDSKYIESLKKHICETLCLLDNHHNILIKTNNNIEGLNIFNRNFLYTAYADNIIFLYKKYKFCNRNYKNV